MPLQDAKVGDYFVVDLFADKSEMLLVIIGRAGRGYPKDWFRVLTTNSKESFIFAPTMSHRVATDTEILKARLLGLCPH